MNTTFTKLLLSAVAAFSFLLPADSENIPDKRMIEAFRQNPYRAAAGHAPYEAPAPDARYTKAPKGYKAFYISHFGRHGSRLQGSEDVYGDVCVILDSLHSDGLLTLCGDSLRNELHRIWDLHKEQMCAMLTLKGGREHRGIAERMCSRNPEVFRQKNRTDVFCRSTVVARCVESMGYFSTAVKGFNPSLEITMDVDLLTGRTAGAPSPKSIREFSGPAEDVLFEAAGSMPTLAARLFKDPDKAATYVPEGDMGRFLFDVFKAAAGAGCLDNGGDPLRFFTPEELLVCNRIRNIHFSSSYGCFGPTRDIAVRHAYPYAMLVIEEADRAIAGNGRCADLRFAHDKQVGPLLSLLDLEHYNVYTPTDASHNFQAAWKYLSMATNLQMIFYRNNKGDVLVKFLCNERESSLPALQSVDGIFYRWDEVRSHILRRIGNNHSDGRL